MAERTVIADLYRERRPVREIAAIIGRSPSMASRELRRNADHDGAYLPRTTERLALERVRRRRCRRLFVDVELRGVVAALLDKRWGPEQVAYELRERFPDQPHRQLSTETIYQTIYDPACRSPDRPSVDVVDIASELFSGFTDDLRAAGGGGRLHPGRPLGGRLHRGCSEPLGDRHAGRATHARTH